ALYINLTEAVTFNGGSPYFTHIASDGTANISLASDIADNLSLVSVGNNNFYLMMSNESLKLHYTQEFSYILGGTNIDVKPGTTVTLNLFTPVNFTKWYIAAFDSNYSGTVAVIEP
ncbi:MAG: hypothetical protein QW812_05985, partial [Thermoplasmataceae archaeon]